MERIGKMNHEFTAALQPGADGLDTAAMELDEALDQSQTDAEAPVGAALVRRDLRKHIEDPVQRVGCESDAVVPDVDADRPALGAAPQGDFSFGIGVFGGIGEQIGQDLRQTHGIGQDANPIRRPFDVESMALGLDGGARAFDGRLERLPQVDDLLLEREHATRDPRDIEQIVQQRRHVPHLARNDEAAAFQLFV